MSSNEQTLTSLISQLTFSLDGAVLGGIVALAAVDSFLRFKSTSSALGKLRHAPSVKVSDLRYLVLDSDSDSDSDKRLIVLRGRVQPKPGADGIFKDLKSSAIVNPETNESTFIDAVIVQKTQRLIYNEWKGVLGWTYDLRAKLAKPWREQESSTLKAVPFVLTEDGTDYVLPNFDNTRHPLPLITVYQQKQLFNPSPYTFLRKIIGHDYPIGLQDEEKILPVGCELSAVGVCSLRGGVLEIKSCSDMPYYLSLLDKDELVRDLEAKTNTLFWSGVCFGLLSFGILCYAVSRNWHKLTAWRQQRQPQQGTDTTGSVSEFQSEGEESEDEEDVGDVGDGQLCVICLTRRRRSVFIPCGHLVCCHRCCISIEHSWSPKCPVCRQEIRTAMRIYDS